MNAPRSRVLSLPQANIVGRLAACLAAVPVVVSFEHNTRLSRRLFELLYLLLSPRVGMMLDDCARTAEVPRRRHLGRRVPHFVVPLCSFPDCNPLRPFGIPALGEKAIIASVGGLTRTKNHCCLIEAVVLLADRGLDVEAEIFGDGPLRDPLKGLARTGVVERRVTFRGFVPMAAKERTGTISASLAAGG